MRRFLSLTLAAAAVTAAAGQVHDFPTPLYDQWQYPFNFTLGSRPVATCFSSLGTGNPDFDAFNDRDGQLIVAWDTSAQIPPGQGAANYQIAEIVVTLTNASGATWEIDLTVDEWYTYDGTEPDTDPGRPIELFGTGFGPHYTAASWTEFSPYRGGTVLGGTPIPAPRDPFPFVYQDGTGVKLHVEDNVKGRWNEDAGVFSFTPTPWAIGVPMDYDPNNQPTPFEVVFEIDLTLSEGRVLEYFQEQLDVGRVFVTVTSLKETEMFGDPDEIPQFYTKEGTTQEPGAAAPRLTIVLATPGIPGDLDGDGCVDLGDLSTLLSNFGRSDGVEPEDGDIDGDGTVGLSDLSILLSNFGLGDC